MSTNCLVTKLKGSVDNNNLPVFGMIPIKLSCQSNASFQLGLSPGGKIKCVGGTFKIVSGDNTLVDNASEWVNNTVWSTSYITIYAGDNMTLLTDKYKTIRITNYDNEGVIAVGVNAEINLDDFCYFSAEYDNSANSTIINFSPSVTSTFKLSGKLDLANLVYPKQLRVIGVTNNVNNVGGEIEFENVPMDNLIQFFSVYTNTTGNIENLDAPSLTTMRLEGSVGITGDLKVWAQKMWNKGRTSGSTLVSYATSGGINAKVTWDGQTLYAASGSYNPYIIFTNEGVSLSANAPA